MIMAWSKQSTLYIFADIYIRDQYQINGGRM